MQRLFLIFAFILTMSVCAIAETYQITELTTPTINIGGKQLKKGDRFSGTNNIKWVDNKQVMEVKNLATGTLYLFSRKVFESKGAVSSIADYFLKTKEGSSRGGNSAPIFTTSPVKDNFPEKRIALVMGNSNYENLSYLKNAQKDASDISETLKGLGFDVMEIYESDYSGMKTALNNFSSKSKNYDVALFYYAGHGTQEKGENYLVPIERELRMPSEVNFCLNCNDVMELMNAPTKLMFIDACRDTRSWTRSATKGLARMEGPVGSVILFSTESGKTALDGTGDNSPFAQSVIKNISIPNISFNEAMDGVVRDTYMLTDMQQCPLKIGTLLTRFSFNSPTRRTVSNSDADAVSEQMRTAKSYYDKKNYTEALKIYRRLAEQGYAAAQDALGWMYQKGLGVDKSYNEAFKWYEKSAAQGNSSAQYSLGYMYENGYGVPQNYREAATWYRKSADQGYADSQNNLGDLYYYGRGVERNYQEAVRWYKKSADQGNYIAQNNLGFMYSNGYGVERDQKESVKWFMKSAEQGYSVAQNNLGNKYRTGNGVEQNYSEALKWYRKSAEQGNYNAQNNLGNLYLKGLGVERNPVEAVNWFRKSAEQNNALAQYALALAYEEGVGVEKNMQEAYKWYKKAADNGDTEAAEWLKKHAASTSGGNGFTVTGRVVEESGEGIIGATVRVAGTSIGTSTDLDGNFTLKNVPNDAVIEVSYVGYGTQKFKVNSKNASGIKITLKEDSRVIAYMQF